MLKLQKKRTSVERKTASGNGTSRTKFSSMRKTFDFPKIALLFMPKSENALWQRMKNVRAQLFQNSISDLITHKPKPKLKKERRISQ
jgi:hypothetical protein